MQNDPTLSLPSTCFPRISVVEQYWDERTLSSLVAENDHELIDKNIWLKMIDWLDGGLSRQMKTVVNVWNTSQVEVPDGSDLWSDPSSTFPDQNYRVWDLVRAQNIMIRGHFWMITIWSEVISVWVGLIKGRFKRTSVWSEKILSAIGSDQRTFRALWWIY